MTNQREFKQIQFSDHTRSVGSRLFARPELGGHSHHISVPNMLNIHSEAAFVMGLKDSTTNADLMYSRET